MSATQSGHYPIERREGEIARLRVQGAALATDSATMLDKIGVGSGWTCLDLGCGPGGITALLSERVGKSGRVVGLDADRVFVEHARSHAPANAEFVIGDAYHSDLPSGSFDLVHIRFLASTAGEPKTLLREAMRLARPGDCGISTENDCGARVNGRWRTRRHARGLQDSPEGARYRLHVLYGCPGLGAHRRQEQCRFRVTAVVKRPA